MADATDEVVGGGFAAFHGHDFDGKGLIVGAENQMMIRGFHIFHGAIAVLEHGVHIEFAFAVRF